VNRSSGDLPALLSKQRHNLSSAVKMDLPIDAEIKLIIALTAFLCAYQVYLTMIRRQYRRWVRPINRTRLKYGFHLSPFRQLKETDHEEFFDYPRMWPYQFEDLHRRFYLFLPKGGIRRPH